MRLSREVVVGSFARAFLVLAFAVGPAWAEESVTFEVPVKVQNLLDDVSAEVRCFVQGSDGQDLGWNSVPLSLVDGAVDTVATVVVTPFSTNTFTTAYFWRCYLQLIQGDERVSMSEIEFHAPTGGPDDWKYAKPGTTLVPLVNGKFEDN